MRNVGYFCLLTACFAFFPVSQGLACSWDANGVGYPASCGYRGRGGNVVQQPYVPSAAKRADDINSAGVQASNARDFARAASLFEQALQINPNDAAAAINLRNTRAILVNEEGLKATKASNWNLAVSLFEQASRINPNDAMIAKNLTQSRAIAKHFAEQAAAEQQRNAAQEQANKEAQRIARGNSISEAGRKAKSDGNLALAERLFEEAVRLDPNDPVKAADLRNARVDVIDDAGAKAAKAGNFGLAMKLYEEGLRINPDSAVLADHLKTALARQRGEDPGQGDPKQDGNAAIAANKSTGNCTFGTTCSPSNPDLGGPRDNKQVEVDSTMDQLKTAAKSGEEANRKGISDEEAKPKSGCQHDDKGCADYVPNPPIRVPAQSPGAMGLADRIRKTTSDSSMAANLQWYLDLDRQMLNKQADIAAVQKEIDKGGGDSAILNAHRKPLENDLARSKADQVNVVQQMKDHGEKLKLTIDWNEAVSK